MCLELSSFHSVLSNSNSYWSKNCLTTSCEGYWLCWIRDEEWWCVEWFKVVSFIISMISRGEDSRNYQLAHDLDLVILGFSIIILTTEMKWNILKLVICYLDDIFASWSKLVLCRCCVSDCRKYFYLPIWYIQQNLSQGLMWSA